MLKKTYKFSSVLMALLLMALSVMAAVPVAFAADDTTYISEITIVAGEDGQTKLEEAGYTAMFQSLNLVSGSDSTVILGYKKGADAITGLVVSSTKSDSISSDNLKYTLVADVNLNQGTDGTALYLYYTKDKNAGSGITMLDTVSGLTDTDDVLVLKNDGSSPVLTDAGKLANLDAGISNSEIYLLTYRETETCQYISQAVVVSGDSKMAALKKAADSGCDSYLDSDLKKGDGVTYVAYKRTADQADAITSLTYDGSTIKTAKDKTGTYLLDISDAELFTGSFTLGDWAEFYAAGNRAFKLSSGYEKLAASTDECSSTDAGKIYCIWLGNTVAEETTEETTEATTEVTEETSTDVTEETTEEVSTEETSAETTVEPVEEITTDDALTDEYLGIEKEEDTSAGDTTSEEETTADEAAASALSSGSIVAICVCTALIILVCAGLIIFKLRKGRKKSDEEK